MFIYMNNCMNLSNSIRFSDEFINAICTAKCRSIKSPELNNNTKTKQPYGFISGKNVKSRKK